MRGKALAARKQRLRDLARLDATNRCKFCRRALPVMGVVEDWVSGGRFCSFTCYEDFQAAAAEGVKR